ncbi:MAG: HAD family hydrolase [Candidatus Liptonbacteria bacterium RIFCSPLOWO2_01_FULL_56_20]|uniref:HAD family hydrolase n=1 Tax=Candidatus Liptonbacteria bacterium RIFCSPLOWO2_01_FULL_56_20 TaxID=1798652 RepID=A0A1G2CKF2_9BACT|nr:MAG: Metal dependent phosphohydrolase [Parcubacteria group bacterium GW2011_GWB1_56_8]OGZ01737.1 MAG: HAD family hydrolase [Candidatus Liptonbacteria bacterium RIFCSPLOWO2_01_FULL_56_20]
MTITRDEAWRLLTEYVASEGLHKHSLAVEAAMRAYARKYGEDEELWGIAGLLHDFDYEKYPHPDPAAKTGHPFEGVRVLRERGYPEEIIQAILGHAVYSGVPRHTTIAKCLFAVDELCGFLTAIAYVRPEHLNGLTPEKVEEYLKKKRFAEKVNREEIREGMAGLGIPAEEHIRTVIEAMQGAAGTLGF